MAQYTFETLEDFLFASIILPNDYQKVDFIESNGNQVIDTNIPITSNSGICAIYVSTNKRYYNCIVGNFVHNVFAYSLIDNNEKLTMYNAISNNYETFTGNTYNVKYNYKNDGIFAVSNIRISNATTTNRETYTYKIGGFWNQSFIKYNLLIFTSQENITSVFVPCYRKNDNVIGLYDVVNEHFITNTIDSSSFSKGLDVMTMLYQNGDEIIISSTKTHYQYQDRDLVFWYKEQNPLVFRGFTFEETVSKLTFSSLVFRGFSFEESPKIRNVSPLFTAGI